ncbi:MAG TPA: endonuclease III [Chloroflexota bacterium]
MPADGVGKGSPRWVANRAGAPAELREGSAFDWTHVGEPSSCGSERVKRRSPRLQTHAVISRLEPLYGHLSTGLIFSTPLELLVATILSAQCTDERVNTVTPTLFSMFRTAEEYSRAEPGIIETVIHSCGFFRNKTKNIQATAVALVDRFDGEVPGSMNELVTLPGVARKTANVVLAHAFGRNEGIAVDTHVQRLSRRLGLTRELDPVKIERALMLLVPKKSWGEISDLLIWHGRRVCSARSPHCGECVLADICPSAFAIG